MVNKPYCIMLNCIFGFQSTLRALLRVQTKGSGGGCCGVEAVQIRQYSVRTVDHPEIGFAINPNTLSQVCPFNIALTELSTFYTDYTASRSDPLVFSFACFSFLL